MRANAKQRERTTERARATHVCDFSLANERKETPSCFLRTEKLRVREIREKFEQMYAYTLVISSSIGLSAALPMCAWKTLCRVLPNVQWSNGHSCKRTSVVHSCVRKYWGAAIIKGRQAKNIEKKLVFNYGFLVFVLRKVNKHKKVMLP